MNGIHEVTGSIPVWSTNLRSGFRRRLSPAPSLWAGALRSKASVAFPQTIVYVLKSTVDPTRYYTGLTSNIASRLTAHNAGRVHTANGKPWTIDVIVEFSDEHRAVAFEKYLKSGSGCEFARRHLR